MSSGHRKGAHCQLSVSCACFSQFRSAHPALKGVSGDAFVALQVRSMRPGGWWARLSNRAAMILRSKRRTRESWARWKKLWTTGTSSSRACLPSARNPGWPLLVLVYAVLPPGEPACSSACYGFACNFTREPAVRRYGRSSLADSRSEFYGGSYDGPSPDIAEAAVKIYQQTRRKQFGTHVYR